MLSGEHRRRQAAVLIGSPKFSARTRQDFSIGGLTNPQSFRADRGRDFRVVSVPCNRYNATLKQNIMTQMLLFESLDGVYERVFRELKPRTRVPRFSIGFHPYANLDSKISIDAERAHVTVKLSDLLEKGPPSVLEALSYILLSKLYRKPVPAKHDRSYREYVNRADVRCKALLARQARGRKPHRSPKGGFYDLDELFDGLNQRFFDGQLARPVLSWSRRASRRSLGYYDPAHNSIAISKLFDSVAIPRFLVDYILYHEMLHLKYPAEHRSVRRCVHTKQFKAEERKFPRYTEATELLKNI